MRDLGVLTFHRASNYGAVLQAWALQEVLRSLQVDAEVVDYRSPAIEAHYQPGGWRTLLSPRNVAVALLRNGYHRDRREIFSNFVRTEIPVSCQSYYPDDLPLANAQYRAFLTGSDQVWNYQTAGFDRTFFLDFVSGSGRRGTYAPSFGVEGLPQEYRREYIRLLSDFDSITVREEAGAALVESLLGSRPPVVLDPTLLIGAGGWQPIVSKGFAPDEPFVLVYLLAETPSILRYARELAAERRMPVVYVSQRLFRPFGMRVLSRATPYDYVRLMSLADAVVTNSFHGMSFALNFGRDLHFDYLPEPSRVNSRLSSLATKFSLLDRRIGEGVLQRRAGDAVENSLQKLELDREQSLACLEDTLRRIL